MDYYLSYENCKNRLVEEYKKYGKLIIAYDYDDTVFDFHNKGRDYNNIISLLQRWKNHATFICFSASPKERYSEMKKYLNDNNIPCDKINESVEGTPHGGKIYYNVLLDDRAGLQTTYALLIDLIQDIEYGFANETSNSEMMSWITVRNY